MYRDIYEVIVVCADVSVGEFTDLPTDICQQMSVNTYTIIMLHVRTYCYNGLPGKYRFAAVEFDTFSSFDAVQ